MLTVYQQAKEAVGDSADLPAEVTADVYSLTPEVLKTLTVTQLRALTTIIKQEEERNAA